MVLHTLYGRSFDTNELADLAFLQMSIFTVIESFAYCCFLNFIFDQEYIKTELTHIS